MTDDEIKKIKIIFIKDEIKKFRIAKRKCKYMYKNWFRDVRNNTNSDKFSLWSSRPYCLYNSPKFSDLDDSFYISSYGKMYMTCLHIIYNKLRHNKIEKQHVGKNIEVYIDHENVINSWINEKIHYQHCI